MLEIIVQGGRNVLDALSPLDITILTGLVATGIQYLIRRYKSFAKIVNYLLATVLPLVAAVLAGLVTGDSPLARWPEAFLVAQTAYRFVEWLRANNKAVVAPVAPQQF